jgi:hypothetical protein
LLADVLKAFAFERNRTQLAKGLEANLRDYRPNTKIPKNGIGSTATSIYQCIEEYSLRTLSHPTDRLQAMEGIFGAFRRGMSGYAHHFYGIPILEENRPVHDYHDSYDELSSFLKGLGWEHIPIDKEEDVWREPKFPSWSWSALMGARVIPQFSSFPTMQRHLCVTFTLRNGKQEDLCTFAYGQHDCIEYYPWIDLTTWILTDVTWVPESRTQSTFWVHMAHSSLPDIVDNKSSIRLDDYNEKLDGQYIAAYIGTCIVLSAENSLVARIPRFLIAKRNKDGSSYHRVGTAQYNAEDAVIADESDPEKLAWLPGPEPKNSYNAWKFETVRLV